MNEINMDKAENPEAAANENNEIGKLLLEELQKVHAELVVQNAHNVFGWHRLMSRSLLMQFLKGTAFGLGGIVGVGIVISALAYFLTKIDFIPIIGDWAKLIANEIKKT